MLNKQKQSTDDSSKRRHLRRSKQNKLEMVEHIKAVSDKRMSVEDVLRASDEKYRPLFDNMLNGFAYCRIILDKEDRATDFIYIDVNKAFEKITGLKKEDIVGKKVTEVIPTIKETNPELFDIYGKVALTGKETKFEIFFTPLKIWLSISAYSPAENYFVAIFDNITEQKQAEEEREVMIKLLSLINSSNNIHEMMRLVTVFLRDWSECEAVGIRLAKGEDYPYFITRGFPEEFVQAENRLCSVTKTGEPVRDSQGRIFLECMCGNVISGRYDPSKSFFTKNGSFWTNSTSDLLAGRVESDRLTRTRNRCNTAGYESVALIPLRAGGETFGLLQFNDKEKGHFNAERISLFERLADNLAIGLAQCKAEQSLRTSEAQLSQAVQIAKLGHWEYDAIENQFTFTDQFYSIYRTSAKQVGGYKMSPERYAELFLFPEDVSELSNEIHRAVEATDPNYSSYSEHRVIFGDGQAGYVSVRYFVIKDSQGHTIKTRGVNQDITERKQAEQALLNGEQRLQAALDAAELGIWDWDLVSGQITREGHHARLFGYSEGEFDGNYEAFERRIHPDDLPGLRATVEKSRNEKTEYFCEYRVVWPDGSVHWVQGKGRFRYDKGGRAVRMLGAVRDITKRKQAEDALRESEEKYRTFVQNFQGIAFRGRMDFTSIFCHGSVEQITGYTEKELVAGRPRWDQIICHEDITADFTENAKKLRTIPNYSCEREYRIRRRDGQIRWIHEIIHNICDETGSPCVVQGAIYDITERKRAERELIGKQEFLNRIIDQSPFATWISDAEGTLQMANPALKRMLNLTDEQLIGIYNVLEDPLVEQQGLRELVRSVYEQGRTVSFKCRWSGEDIPKWNLKGSREVNIEATMFPIHDPEGRLTNVVLHWIDVTERERALEALVQSETRYRELFESMSSGVAVYEAVDEGKDFVFKNMNGAGERIDKIRRDDVIGKKVTEAFPGVKEAGLLEVFQNVWRSGKPEHHPISLYKDQRISQWVENYVYKLPTGEIVAVYDDVTNRKEVEEKLYDYQKQLKSMAYQLSNIQEQERRNIAVEMHDRISQRLAITKFNVQIAAKSTTDDKVRDKLQRTAEEIGRVIEDAYSLMLELSNPVLYEIGLKAAIEALLKNRMSEAKQIDYELLADDDFKLDDVIKVPLYQAVRELLTNVVKHSRANKIVVCIRKVGNHVQITVKDNGVGFDKSTMRKSDTIREGGFGLFSIRENLEHIKGNLEIKTKPGRGTVAIITAPQKYQTGMD